MDDAFFMRRGQPAGDLHPVVNRLAHRQAATPELFPQGFPFQQFRDQIRCTFVAAQLVHRQNVGMVQRREAARASCSKRRSRSRSAERNDGKTFDRHIAAQPRIAGAIDPAHAARTKQRFDLIVPQLRTRCERDS